MSSVTATIRDPPGMAKSPFIFLDPKEKAPP